MRNDFESNYLAHHGILGMKWGKKNGPPYPLGASDHSAAEKKAGWRKSLGGGRNESLYDRKISEYRKKQNEYSANARDIKTQGYGESYAYEYLDKKAKKYKEKADKVQKLKEDNNGRMTKGQKAIVIGAAVAGTALIAYGAYKVSKDPRVKALINVGKVSAQQAALRNKQKLSSVDLAKSDKLIKDAISSAEKLAKTAPAHRSTTTPILEFGTSTQKFTKADQDRLSEISNNLLREAQKRNGIATDNTTSFDYAKELIKKNRKTLSQYTMQDLKDLDLY